MENPVEKLTKKIAWHESEAKRLRAALEVLQELDREAEKTAHQKFAEMKFLEAVRVILANGAKKKARDIRDELEAGGFKSGAGDFGVMVANRLADAGRRNQLVKNGEGKGLTWSLPRDLNASSHSAI